jgi:hypothetical protein
VAGAAAVGAGYPISRLIANADLAAIVLGLAIFVFLALITEFMREPPPAGYGFGSSPLVAGLCLVPFSLMSLLASRTTIRITRLRDARRPRGCRLLAPRRAGLHHGTPGRRRRLRAVRLVLVAPHAAIA